METAASTGQGDGASGPAQIRVGLAGYGYWGPHLLRNLSDLPGAETVAVAEPRADRQRRITTLYPGVRCVADHRQLLELDLDAVVVATPIRTHHEVARDALLAGKHVLVEKPLAANSNDALELVQLAAEVERIVMVGHTFMYNPAARELRRLVQEGELGKVQYVDSARLNLGLFQPTVNVLWDLAPHDISILLHVLGRLPLTVSAHGRCCVRPGVHDVAYLEVILEGGLTAQLHVSWLDPDKVRRMTVVGDRRMAVYDDVSPTEKIRVYDSGVEVPETDSFGEFQLSYRHGEIRIPYIDWHEPLRLECEDFVESIRTGCQPLANGLQGLLVVAVLEAAEHSLLHEGVRVPVGLPLPALDVIPRLALDRRRGTAHRNDHENGRLEAILGGAHG
ncbi:MAG: Gfo/Idh/MocA family oxidoreductase [Candidatus Dormiibacterota bacterium]